MPGRRKRFFHLSFPISHFSFESEQPGAAELDYQNRVALLVCDAQITR